MAVAIYGPSYGAVTVADDLAVMSDTRNWLQDLVYEAQSDASRERNIYNTTKTKVQVVNPKKTEVDSHIY